MKKILLLCVLPYFLFAGDDAGNNVNARIRKRMEPGAHSLLTPQERAEATAQLVAVRTQGGDLEDLTPQEDRYGEGLRKRRRRN